MRTFRPTGTSLDDPVPFNATTELVIDSSPAILVIDFTSTAFVGSNGHAGAALVKVAPGSAPFVALESRVLHIDFTANGQTNGHKGIAVIKDI